MNSIFNLNEKVAIVTGGYGHLGAAMTEALLEHDAIVIVAGRNRDNFNSVFEKIKTDNLKFHYLELTDTGSINDLIKDTQQEFGRIDILINNATASKGTSQESMTDEQWTYTLENSLGAVHKCIRAVMPVMKRQQGGKIINIASMYGMVSPDFNLYEGNNCEQFLNPPHYGAAKAGIIQLTKYYAVYLGKYNIQVNVVSPGPFPKLKIQQENPEFIRRLSAKNPLNRIGKPQDIKGLITLLSSNASDFITGQNLVVDGGWTIW